MIISRTPLRISFCGGGTDLPSYYQQGFGAVCSLAINKYIYVSVKSLPDLFPFKYKLSYSQTELVNETASILHPIIKECLKYYLNPSLDFNSMADIPGGTGMGSSSAFTVGVLRALDLLRNKNEQKQHIAEIACEIEINRLKEPIGKQDQYAAAFGGLNYIRFNANDTVQVHPIVIDPYREKKFLDTLSLYYLGKPTRGASELLKVQKTCGSELDRMRDSASVCTDVLTSGHPYELGELLREGWELKKSLSPHISSSEIDNYINTALSNGAYGGKLLGAGGSGFLLISAPPEKKFSIGSALGLKEIAFHPDYFGSRAYYIGDL